MDARLFVATCFCIRVGGKRGLRRELWSKRVWPFFYSASCELRRWMTFTKSLISNQLRCQISGWQNICCGLQGHMRVFCNHTILFTIYLNWGKTLTYIVYNFHAHICSNSCARTMYVNSVEEGAANGEKKRNPRMASSRKTFLVVMLKFHDQHCRRLLVEFFPAQWGALKMSTKASK